MDWFCHEVGMSRHPRMASLAHRLHKSRLLAFAHVCAFFEGVAQHAEDGRIDGVTDELIESWAEWSGMRGAFAEALREVGILDGSEVHGWDMRHGYFVRERARRRADGARTARNPRAENAESARGFRAPTEPNRTEPNRTRVLSEPEPPDAPHVDNSVDNSGSGSGFQKNSSGSGLPPSSKASACAGFESIFESGEAAAKWRSTLNEQLYGEYGPAIISEVERSIAEIAVSARKHPNKTPAAYAIGILKRPKHVREIAVRVREKILELENSRRAVESEHNLSPPTQRPGGAVMAGHLVTAILAGISERTT